MNPAKYTALIVLLCLISCRQEKSSVQSQTKDIAGCWKGGLVLQPSRPDSQYRLISLRPDSSPALSLIFELGPRSRVWNHDVEVTVAADTIRWAYHQGVLSPTRDTMTVWKDYQGERSLWRFVRNRSTDSLMLRLKACAAGDYHYAVPRTCGDGWTCADLEDVGIDKTKIVRLLERISDGKYHDIHSLLIVREGKLVVEAYFAENGKKHGSFIDSIFRDRVHHLASTTKAVTSTLVGIAIEHGFIADVDDPIHLYLPEYAHLFDETKKQIRIKDMLTMTPGFKWRQFGVSESDPQNDGTGMWRTDDVIGFVLQKPLDAVPGKKFNYTNGTPTVIGRILKNAVAMEVKAFAEKYLFQPLGIGDYIWTGYPDGSLETDGGLALRSRDLAKIGLLFLNRGEWKGERIVSKEWMEEATKARLRFGRFLRWGYGYHWMQAESSIGESVVSSYFVPGDGNQILAVFPQLDMVVVFTAGNYNRDPKSFYYNILKKFIFPAVHRERRRG